MKKSFRPSKSMKSSSPKPMKSSSGSHSSFSSAPGGFKQAKQPSSFMPGQNRVRGRRATPLIVVLVLVVCCLLVVCIAGVYYVFSQGLITLPNFG